MPHKILIIEDEEWISTLLTDYLEASSYSTRVASTAAAAGDALSADTYDLVILDLNLPDADGMELLDRIRTTSRTPTFVVTGSIDDRTMLDALERGADDYITKPFRLRELSLRITNCLSRIRRQEAGKPPPDSDALAFHGWVLRKGRRQLVAPDGTPMPISRAEFDVLETLVEARGEVVGRDTLVNRIAGNRGDANPETLTVIIYRLRKKLATADDDAASVIVTVPSVGYRIATDG